MYIRVSWEYMTWTGDSAVIAAAMRPMPGPKRSRPTRKTAATRRMPSTAERPRIADPDCPKAFIQ